jgi:hypothetical protein
MERGFRMRIKEIIKDSFQPNHWQELDKIQLSERKMEPEEPFDVVLTRETKKLESMET